MRKRKLTYGGNHAIINGKNGAVVGGTVYFQSGPADNAKIIFQIKSSGVGRDHFANLHGDMLGQGAVMAVFLALETLIGPMKAEAKGVGTNHHDLMHHNYDRNLIMEEIIGQGTGLDIPLSLETDKRAWANAAQDTQKAMFADCQLGKEYSWRC